MAGVPTIPRMALTVGDRTVRPLTADQVMAMLSAGIIPQDNRLELLGGVLTEKPVKSPEHEAVKERLVAWLAPGVAEGRYLIRVEGCLVVPDVTSLPEPDVMVLAPSQDPGRHPTSALLVIEVALTSVLTDLQDKPALYAAAGVPEYWVVDVENRMTVAFSGPGADGYGVRLTTGPGHRVAAGSLGLAPLDLGELFAGLAPATP